MLPNLFYKHNPFTVCSLFFYRIPEDLSSLRPGTKQQIQNAQVWLKVHAKELGVGYRLIEISLRKRTLRHDMTSYVRCFPSHLHIFRRGNFDRKAKQFKTDCQKLLIQIPETVLLRLDNVFDVGEKELEKRCLTIPTLNTTKMGRLPFLSVIYPDLIHWQSWPSSHDRHTQRLHFISE